MTYKSFSSMERQKAIEILGSRILNNVETTYLAIIFCHNKDLCYRLSSDLFPLITYDLANLSIEDFPQKSSIDKVLDNIKDFISVNKVRISTHPDQFNTLASENKDSLNRTIKELNFQSWLMDRIGCSKDYNSPINLHINNNKGDRKEIVNRLVDGISQLDESCRKRLVFENDDKKACWSVRLLKDYLYEKTKIPITFDYLHHKCHSDDLLEEKALSLCYETWGDFKPLFHYSESKEGNNPRAHADYPEKKFNNYGFDFDLDFEFKMKDKAISHYQKST